MQVPSDFRKHSPDLRVLQDDQADMVSPDVPRGLYFRLSTYLLEQESDQRRQVEGDHFPPISIGCCDELLVRRK